MTLICCDIADLNQINKFNKKRLLKDLLIIQA